MPKLIYSAAKGLYETAGSGILIEKTDATLASNAATANGTAGNLQLEAEAIATGTTGTTETITDSRVTASSVVIVNLSQNADATKGAPTASIIAVSAGQFTFRIGNAHGADAVTKATCKVSYLVV
jgi:hypothetical protein